MISMTDILIYCDWLTDNNINSDLLRATVCHIDNGAIGVNRLGIDIIYNNSSGFGNGDIYGNGYGYGDAGVYGNDDGSVDGYGSGDGFVHGYGFGDSNHDGDGYGHGFDLEIND